MSSKAPDFPTIRGQLAYATGKQGVTCQKCGNLINITVGGEKREQQRGKYRPYRGSCRKCGEYYSSNLWGRTW